MTTASKITAASYGQEVSFLSAKGEQQTGELVSVDADVLGENDPRVRIQIIQDNTYMSFYVQPDTNVSFTIEGKSPMFTTENRGVTMVTEVASSAQSGLPKNAEWRVTFEDGVQAVGYHAGVAAKVRFEPRVYGALDALVPDLMELEPYRGYAIPVSGRDRADELRSKIWAAWKRGVVAEAKARLIQLLEAVTDEDIDPKQITFSINAGCSSCPCSPGFIVKGVDSLHGLSSIWFTKP